MVYNSLITTTEDTMKTMSKAVEIATEITLRQGSGLAEIIRRSTAAECYIYIENGETVPTRWISEMEKRGIPLHRDLRYSRNVGDKFSVSLNNPNVSPRY